MARDKKQKFREVAGKRVQYIIDKIDLLGNCSNRNNYEYDLQDVKKMVSAIRDALKRCESAYEDELTKKNKKRFQF